MKALVKTEAGPGLKLQDVKEPEVGHNDVLIKIHKTAIARLFEANDRVYDIRSIFDLGRQVFSS